VESVVAVAAAVAVVDAAWCTIFAWIVELAQDFEDYCHFLCEEMYSFVVKYLAFYLVKKKKVLSYLSALQQKLCLGLYQLHLVISEGFLNNFHYLASSVELFGC